MDLLSGIFSGLASAFEKGGAVMWVILFFSIYATALGVERWLHYLRLNETLSSEWDIVTRDTGDAKRNGGDADTLTTGGRLAAVAVRTRDLVKEERADRMRTAFLEETALVEKYLNTIAVIASLLPMLGLLGTVVGMVSAFEAISQYGTGDPKIVASGISQALLTTEAGLIASIPLTYFHNILSGRADHLIRRINEFATHILHVTSGEGG